MRAGGSSSNPYISFVVTTRNDDHGGTLLRRTQTFLNALLAQCKRHNVSAELVIVEWNPPADRPPLADVLKWPSEPGPCQVRFIEVPAKIHAKYEHAEGMPLYQMIAKNVGIRRARGEFIVATNIDIIFNDEIFHCFADRQLQHGKMYRIDRHDVMTEVPVDAPIEEQLAFCASHLLRVNAREGTFAFEADGRRALEKVDIASQNSGIRFEEGWFGVEWTIHGEPLRYAATGGADLHLEMRAGRRVLLIELEPWHGVHKRPFMLQVLNEQEQLLSEFWIRGRSRIGIELSDTSQGTRNIRLRAARGGASSLSEPRILNFMVYNVSWHTSPQAESNSNELLAVRSDAETLHKGVLGWVKTAVSETRKEYPQLSPAARIPLVLRYLGKSFLHRGGVVGLVRLQIQSFTRPANIVNLAGDFDVFQQHSNFYPGAKWHDLERFFGETFRWITNDAEMFVHRPDAELRNLVMYVEPGPGFQGQPFELTVQNEGGKILGSAHVSGLQRIEIPLDIPTDEARVILFHVEGGGALAKNDPRIMNFRVFWCGWSGPAPKELTGHEADVVLQRIETAMQKRVGLAYSPAVHLHTNACGDFTMMSRQQWFDLRGYAEFDMYSFHIDSLLCHTAHHGGAIEEVFPEPMRIYHIEHAAGSGWTPEGENKLFQRLREKQINWIEYGDLVTWGSQMRYLKSPMIFNLENWGLANLELPESRK